MTTPWYKQFWPWFLIGLPASVVIASLFTFSLFSQNKVSLVAEDYYKKGKGINLDLSRLAQADALNIHAQMQLNQNNVLFTLDKGNLDVFPTLHFLFQHRTLSDQDIKKTVNPDASGRYRFSLNDSIDGPWYIEVTSFDNQWSVNARQSLPISEPFMLYGKNKG